MRLFASSPCRTSSVVASTTGGDHHHANDIILNGMTTTAMDGSVIENTHFMRDISKSGYRPPSRGGSNSFKKHKTNNFNDTAVADRSSRSKRHEERHHYPQHLEEYKSRSLERYAKPPHTLAAAAAAALDEDGDDEEEIYAAARRTLTPSLSTQRRRLLSPFVSMKRRSRSSISSSGSRSTTHTDSREVNFNVMLPPLKLPGRMQDHIMEHQKSNSNISCLKSKHMGHNSASSQSSDSGTGGTELEQDCSRTSAAESSQLSLSYSHLSSASSSRSLSKDIMMSLKNSHSNVSLQSEERENDETITEQQMLQIHYTQQHQHEQHQEQQHYNQQQHQNHQHQKQQHQNQLHPNQQHHHQQHVSKERHVSIAPLDDEYKHDADDVKLTSASNKYSSGQNYRDSVFSSDDFYCGNITLVDDTYSNYDPENDAERMFLQVVGILRDEKEVGIIIIRSNDC